jgi:hypothetical protein
MNINLNNYEAYFLDYHEGSLSPASVKELMDFISQHPELKEEFESFEPITLNDREEIKFNAKDTLKKQQSGVTSGNFDEYAIGFVEGTLSFELQKELKTFISQNPSYQKELELYSKTKLVPDTSIVFDDKLSLKRRTRKFAVYYYWSAAASVALLVVSYFMLNRNTALTGNIVANHNQIKDTTTVASHLKKVADSTVVKPRIVPNNPSNTLVKNSRIAINSIHNKYTPKKITSPLNQNNDSTEDIIIGNSAPMVLNSLPLKNLKAIPNNSENSSLAIFKSLSNTFTGPVYSLSNTAAQNFANADEPNTKKRGKFLYLLAKYTCKGLHKITGQHIEMEKRYDSDTTNIIAYQLDLGKAKINFPVKE